MATSNTLTNMYNKHIKEYGINVLVGEETIKAFFGEYNESRNSTDYKYMFSDLETIKQGDVIVALGKRWLVVANPVNINNAYKKALLREIKFCLKHNNKSIPCVLDSNMQSIDTGGQINLANGDVMVTIPENDTTRAIEMDTNFFVANGKYKIVGFDYSERGLIIMYAEKDAWSDEEKIWSACDSIPDPDAEPIERSIRFNTGVADAKVTIKIEVGEEEEMIGTDQFGRPIWDIVTVYTKVENFTDADGKVEVLVEDLEQLEEIQIDSYDYIIEKDGHDTVEGTILKEDISEEGLDIQVDF